MPDRLERLLGELRAAPPDRPLDRVSADVADQLAEAAALRAQTWRVRAAAILFIALSGVAVSAATTAAAAPDTSPFAAWSALAPSTLLEPND
jgi:hypothetical protein